MDFCDATTSFEAWLGKQTPLVASDLRHKHQRMAENEFSFLRATYYRWAQVFPQLCPDLMDAPRVRAVGDLHAENFGTWRDIEGRLVWGVNDFDEASRLPYTNDLVRLAASLRIAIRCGALHVTAGEAGRAILDGYEEWMTEGGRAFVLAERSAWLRLLAHQHLGDPVAFWERIQSLPPLGRRVPAGLQRRVRRSMPDPGIDLAWCSRRAGMGSLGRIRIVAHGKWKGGMIARELRAMAPPATLWASGSRSPARSPSGPVPPHAIRCPDPVLSFEDGWMLRRLSPDCSKVNLSEMPVSEELRFLRAMGRETANIHLGSRASVPAIRRDLVRRRRESRDWLSAAAVRMVRQTRSDWKDWRLHEGGGT